MRTYFYIIKHALKPEDKIHVWTFYIPMYQCAVSRNAAFLYAPSLSHLFFFQNSHFCIVFHKKSCKFRWTSLLQKLFHPILPFIHRQLFLYATPFQLCKVVVKYFYFEFIAIDTRHKTQDTDVYVTLLTSKVHIFWEGHKIMRNLPLTFDYST